MMQKTEDGGRETEDRGKRMEETGRTHGRGRSSFLLPQSSVFRFRSPVSLGRRLLRDNEGQALLETVVVFPVLLLFILVLMELSMMYSAKQLANYAAFCAARTAAVNGIGDTVKTHFAAAMAMSSIASANNGDAEDVLKAYGVDDPTLTVAKLCEIPGFVGDDAKWKARLANAYLRTYLPQCDTTGTPLGRRKHVAVDVTYIYRCNFAPFGVFWGKPGIDAYCALLAAFPFHSPYTYAVVTPFITVLQGAWRWNITIHGRAVTDYWAG